MLVLYPQTTSLSGFFRAQLITLQVGIFPIGFIVFMKQMTLYRRFAAEAKEVSDDIHVEKEQALRIATTPELTLRGDNQKEEIRLLADDLFFISSADNYVKVQSCEGQERKETILRSSLKKIEEQLQGHPEFFRCHRMYIVNLRLVSSVSGNAQGLKLHLSGLEEAIPVSRTLTETVREKLHRLSRSPQNV
jgi:DNA-binding LytR/AlgR family response regulator